MIESLTHFFAKRVISLLTSMYVTQSSHPNYFYTPLSIAFLNRNKKTLTYYVKININKFIWQTSLSIAVVLNLFWLAARFLSEKFLRHTKN